MKMQNSAPVSSNLAVLGSFKAGTQLTLAVPKCNAQCANVKKPNNSVFSNIVEAQWQIGYGVGLRIKRSSVRIRPWPLR